MPDVLAMRWEEAIAKLHQEGCRVAGLEVTGCPRQNHERTGRWRVVRQLEVEPGFVSLTLARELGYRGKPIAVP